MFRPAPGTTKRSFRNASSATSDSRHSRCPRRIRTYIGSCTSVRRIKPGTGSTQKPMATSSRRLSSSRHRWPVVASEASTSMPGCCSRSRASSVGRISYRAAGVAPSRKVPSTPAPARVAAANAASTAANAELPSASSRRPASVSSTCRVVRVNSSTPSSPSSWRIAALSGDAAMCSRSAAREKLSSSATATK